MWYKSRMAKKSKSSKKPAPVKKQAKSAPKKAAPKKPAAKKPAGRSAAAARALEPVPVGTGKAPTVAEVGGALVAMFNAGKLAEIENNYWSPSIVSCEGSAGLEWRGRAAVEAKNHGWLSENEIVGASAEGPYVGATAFAVKFRMQVRSKRDGKTMSAEEIGVYHVQNGKIVREEFMGN